MEPIAFVLSTSPTSSFFFFLLFAFLYFFLHSTTNPFFVFFFFILFLFLLLLSSTGFLAFFFFSYPLHHQQHFSSSSSSLSDPLHHQRLFFFSPLLPSCLSFFSSFSFFLSFFLLQTHSPCSSTHKYIPKNRNPLLIFIILVFDLRIPGFGFGFSVFMGLSWQFWITDLKILCWCVWVFYVCSCGLKLGL